jgi:hypothetical protein
LGEEGLAALGPKLSQALDARFRLVSTDDLGADVLDIYERER